MTPALRLEGPDQGLATLVFDTPDSKVNVLGRDVIEELATLLDDLEGRSDISCLVLMSGKPRNFIAGADIDAIEQVEDPADVREAVTLVQGLYSRWEKLPYPTIAAISGSCMGGGTEWALASTYIVIADRPDLRIGLPETRLGILPGWGGCTRLPRRVGLTAALDVILAGKNVNAYKAFKIGLADALMPPASFRHHVRDFARQTIAGKPPVKERATGVKDALLEKNPLGRKIVFDQAGKQVLKMTGGNYPAPLRALEVVRTGIEQGSSAGFEAEARGISELAVSRESKSLVHVFRLMEGAGKGGRSDGGKNRPIRRAAVLGAGVMGGGIAQLLAAKASVPVRLKDIAPEPLAQGMAHARQLFDKQVQRRRITKPQALENMNRLRPTLDYSGFSSVDLVVEAIVERLDVKQKVFAELSAIVPESAILASNTSSLSIEAIGRDVEGPERVIGMHFFNPVDKMPLVEIVVSPLTSPDVTDSIVALCGTLGKTPVVVKDGPGFLVNRLLMFSMAEALSLLEDGVSIPALDRTMKQWGMPMGPVTLTDEVGLDVATHVAGILVDAFGDRLHVPEWIGRMVEAGRLGAKVGKGFYRYEGGKRVEPDPAVYDLLGLSPTNDQPDVLEVGHRIVLPMLNEAARCLSEGVVRDAADLDLAMIMGTGFPPFRGGLCRWADDEGPELLRERMEALAEKIGPRFAPSDAFTERRLGRGLLFSLSALPEARHRRLRRRWPRSCCKSRDERSRHASQSESQVPHRRSAYSPCHSQQRPRSRSRASSRERSTSTKCCSMSWLRIGTVTSSWGYNPRTSPSRTESAPSRSSPRLSTATGPSSSLPLWQAGWAFHRTTCRWTATSSSSSTTPARSSRVSWRNSSTPCDGRGAGCIRSCCPTTGSRWSATTTSSRSTRTSRGTTRRS